MKIVIVGLGEIGTETFLAMVEKLHADKKDPFEIMFGVDVNDARLEDFHKMAFRAEKEIPQDGSVYIISVYTPEQIRSVIDRIPLDKKPLVVIESTLEPGESKKLVEKYPGIKLVLFPHRYNPNDPAHHVFNLNRLISAYDDATLFEAMNFYGQFIDSKFLFAVRPQIAELSKPLENAYRFIEIAIAEEIKMMCEDRGIDFEELRAAMNTKWNIDVKEARDGIGGKCLPKDCNFINSFFKDNIIFEAALAVDDIYRGDLKEKGIKPSEFRVVKQTR